MLTLGEKLQTYKLKNCVVETFVAFSRVASNVATFGKDYISERRSEHIFEGYSLLKMTMKFGHFGIGRKSR